MDRPARRGDEDGRNRLRTSLALRPEAVTGREGNGGYSVAYKVGVKAWLVRVRDKYTARATGYIEKSTLIRYGRPIEGDLYR